MSTSLEVRTMKALRWLSAAVTLAVLLTIAPVLTVATVTAATVVQDNPLAAFGLAGAVVLTLMPFATTLVMSGLKAVIGKVDDLAALPQQLIVLVIGFGIVKLATVSGIALPGDLHGWGPEIVTAVLNWLAAMGLHKVLKK
jgi:hypothetical protein